MLRIVDCLTVDHDYGMVLLAALLCLLGSVCTMIVAGRTAVAERRLLWLTLLSICFSATAWSTHFIAMLAFRTELPITFDPLLTVLSFVAGAVFMAGGFAIAVLHRAEPQMRWLGGAFVASGVTALHYIGMSGLRFPGTVNYDPDLVVVSILAGLAFGMPAASVMFGPARRFGAFISGGLLVAMTVSLHFTGMSAVVLELGSLVATEAGGISRAALVIGVAIAFVAVLVIGTLSAVIDQRVSARLEAESERFRTLADGAFEGLVVHQNGLLVDANKAARKMLGLGPASSGQRIDHWNLAYREYIDAGTEYIEELELISAEGRPFPAELCRRRIFQPDGTPGELVAIRDLTARKAHEARISHLALHDPLTDLPNRRLFTELSAKALHEAEMSGHSFALMAIDLDNFKIVNDLHGHAGGDQLICAVADRLLQSARDGAVVARLGGDEFALLETSAVQPGPVTLLAQRVQESLREVVRLNDAEILANASIGIAVYPNDGTDIETLMSNADTAMYQAKADGKATTKCFEPRMNAMLEKRRHLESRLQRAIEDGALSVHYQPLVATSDGLPCSLEALLRWNDSDLGSVSPATFIPIAESTGLIIEIGEFVLREACRQASSWPASVRVAVNFSVAQFGRPGLVDMVRQALQDSGLPGHRLIVEVTESLLIDDRDNALLVLNQLRALGTRIAMDDFGTGFSSLRYLQIFAFDKIKIDRSFVCNIEENRADASIVQAIVTMGQSLNMKVVAEGVETEGQASLLARFNCDELQGYLIARPMPAEDASAYLQAQLDQPPRLLRYG